MEVETERTEDGQLEDGQLEGTTDDEADALMDEETAKEDQLEHQARDYQLELYNLALKKNIIVCLKTGSGKTFISILLIKELQHEILKPFDQEGKVTFFLVPKVALVAQQALSIESHTTLKVGQYHGGCRVDVNGSKCHIDEWNQSVWAKEFQLKQVFVMTAQILLNLLNHSFITMNKINLIVMDECHRATGNDPYCNIMKFYERALSKPKILGLTAAVLHGRCKPANITRNIEKLEETLYSRIVTVSNLEEVNKFSTKPKEALLEYPGVDASNRDLDLKIEEIFAKCEKEIKEITTKLNFGDIETTGAVSNREEEGRLVSHIENKSHILKKLNEKAESASEDANGINFKCSPEYLLKNVRWVYQILGIWPMREILKSFLMDLPNFEASARNSDQLVKCKIFSILKEHFNKLNDLVNSAINAMGDCHAILAFVTPKVKRLLDLLKVVVKGFSPFRGIVFVEQRSIAWMLDHYLRQLRQLHLRDYEQVDSCYVVGHGLSLAYTFRTGMNVDDQAESLLLFKNGKRNLLVGTSVVEEGLDIPECNVVIRFDLPKTFCSYVQSKGRARAQKALFFLMYPDGDKNEVENTLVYYRVLEEELIKISMKNKKRQLDEVKPNNANTVSDMYFRNTALNAAITLDSAISILDRYCAKLPHDRFTVVKPIYHYVKDEADLSQVCGVVQLPSTTSLIERIIWGAKQNDKKTAKKIAAFEACLKLLQAGELNDHLLPAINFIERYGHELGIAELKDTDKGRVKSGTRKRKYPYDKAVAENLTKCYIVPNCPLYLYEIRLSKMILNQNELNKNPRFGILTSKQITKVLPFQLFGKLACVVTINLVKNFQDHTVFQNIEYLKEFQNFIFDDVCNITNLLLEFSPEETGSFVIVPLNGNVINWDLVNECYKFKNHVDDQKLKIPKVGNVILTKYGGLGVRNRRFFVTRVSQRDTILDEIFLKAKHYLEKKYNVVVSQENQPLVTCDHVPNGLNLLHSEIGQKAPPKAAKLDTMYFFPEFLKIFPLNIYYYREAFCLPSIIHRLNGLLLANELKWSLINEASIMPANRESKFVIMANTLEKHCKDSTVDDAVIFSQNLPKPPDPDRLLAVLFQAITTASAANWDSLERLEVIGDSFLKIATSICLYCRYPVLHEGGLTTLRTGLVRNFNLVKHSKNIPQILNASSFLPRVSWVPPGYKIPSDLITALVVKSVPNHLWGHAKIEDIRTELDLQSWQKILQERWANAEPSKRMSEEKVTTKYEVSETSENSESNNAKEEVMFDRYYKQLVGDKTIADSVEAIIGAVLVTCGRSAALRTLEWFGLKLLPPNEPEVMEVDEGVSAFPWTLPKEYVERWNSKMSDRYIDLLNFEKEIGYTFKNKGLLIQAVMHPTYDQDVVEHYQKLEFLGDAVLDYLVTMHLSKLFPNLSPGNMTDLRSSLVDNCTFAFLAVENNMNKILRFKSGLLFTVIDDYVEHKKNLEHPKDTIYLTGENDYSSMEEIEVPKALGDIFESIAGAIFVDSGLSLECVWEVYYPMLKSIIEQYSKALPINPVRCVIETYPNAKFSKPSKPVGSHYFRVTVDIDGKVFHGQSKKSKIAKIAAAKSALRSLNILSERSFQ